MSPQHTSATFPIRISIFDQTTTELPLSMLARGVQGSETLIDARHRARFVSALGRSRRIVSPRDDVGAPIRLYSDFSGRSGLERVQESRHLVVGASRCGSMSMHDRRVRSERGC